MRIIIVEGLGNNGSQFENKGENAPLSQKDFQTLALATVTNPTKERITELASYLNKDNVNARLVGESAILHIAVMYSSLDRDEQAKANRLNLINMLITKGADLDMQGPGGNTALHYACFGDAKSMEIAQNLVRAGASPTIKNNYEDTALSLLEPEEAKQLQASKVESKPTISQFADNARAAFEGVAPKTNNQKNQTKRDNMSKDKNGSGNTTPRSGASTPTSARSDSTSASFPEIRISDEQVVQWRTSDISKHTKVPGSRDLLSSAELQSLYDRGLEPGDLSKGLKSQIVQSGDHKELHERNKEIIRQGTLARKSDAEIAKGLITQETLEAERVQTQRQNQAATKIQAAFRGMSARSEAKNLSEERNVENARNLEGQQRLRQEQAKQAQNVGKNTPSKKKTAKSQKAYIDGRAPVGTSAEQLQKIRSDAYSDKLAPSVKKAELNKRKEEYLQILEGHTPAGMKPEMIRQLRADAFEGRLGGDVKQKELERRQQAAREFNNMDPMAPRAHLDGLDLGNRVNFKPEATIDDKILDSLNIDRSQTPTLEQRFATFDPVLKDKYISNHLAYKALECAAIVNEVKGNVAAGKANKSDLHKAQEAARASMIAYLCDVMQNKVNVVKDEVIVEIANNYQRAMDGAPTPYKQVLVEMVREHGMEAVQAMPTYQAIARLAGIDLKDVPQPIVDEKYRQALTGNYRKEKYDHQMEAEAVMGYIDAQSRENREGAKKHVASLEAGLEGIKKLPEILAKAEKVAEKLANPPVEGNLDSPSVKTAKLESELESLEKQVAKIMQNAEFENGKYKITVGEKAYFVEKTGEEVKFEFDPARQAQYQAEAYQENVAHLPAKLEAAKQDLEYVTAERKEVKNYRDGQYFTTTSKNELAVMSAEFNQHGISDMVSRNFEEELKEVSDRAAMMKQLVKDLDGMFAKEHAIEVQYDSKNSQTVKMTRGQIISVLVSNVPADDLANYIEAMRNDENYKDPKLQRDRLLGVCKEVVSKHADINIKANQVAEHAVKHPMTMKVSVPGSMMATVELDKSGRLTFAQEAAKMKQDMQKDNSPLKQSEEHIKKAETIYKHAKKQHEKTPLWNRAVAWFADKANIKTERFPESLRPAVEAKKQLAEKREEMLKAYKRLHSIKNNIETACELRPVKLERDYLKGREIKGAAKSVADTFSIAKDTLAREARNTRTAKDLRNSPTTPLSVPVTPASNLRKKSGTGLGA